MTGRKIKKTNNLLVSDETPVFAPLPPADGSEKISRPLADAILAPDEAVRWQAGNLRDAIIAARAAGFVIATPFRLDDLDRITISATSKAK